MVSTGKGLTEDLAVAFDDIVVEDGAVVAMVMDCWEEVGGVSGGLSGIMIGASLDVGEAGGLERGMGMESGTEVGPSEEEVGGS